MPRIDLGFIPSGTIEPWKLHRAFFKSKIGGFPAWLNPDRTPSVICDNCKSSMVLLLQLYAPREESYSYHRTIFVFMCRDVECHQEYKYEVQQVDDIERKIRESCNISSAGGATNNNSNNGRFSSTSMETEEPVKTPLKLPYKVYRCQLPQKNMFYDSNPSSNYENDRSVVVRADQKLANDFCFNCGQCAKSRCTKCKAVAYCCKNCQTIHWKTMHKTKCQAWQEASSKQKSGTKNNNKKKGGKNGKGSRQKSSSSISNQVKNSNFVYPNSQSSWSYNEMEIIVEPEPKVDKIKNQKELDRLNKQLMAEHKNELKQEEVDQTVTNKNLKIDKYFLKFQNRLNRDPEQILRYYEFYDQRCELKVSKTQAEECKKYSQRSGTKLVPPCPYCKNDRSLEFQITPQILNYIKPEKNPLNNHLLGKNNRKITASDLEKMIDFGVLNVYTCDKNCDYMKLMNNCSSEDPNNQSNYSEEQILRYYPMAKSTVYEVESTDTGMDYSENEESESESEYEGSELSDGEGSYMSDY